MLFVSAPLTSSDPSSNSKRFSRLGSSCDPALVADYTSDVSSKEDFSGPEDGECQSEDEELKANKANKQVKHQMVNPSFIFTLLK